VLLADGSGGVIYAAVLDDDKAGFLGEPVDYELLVPEDASGNSVGTEYHFWVVLE